MPTIVRWFPISHDINADPEMWELTEKVGDRGLRVWLEILSIADRNEGLIGSDSDQLYKTLATKCRLRSNKVRTILQLSCNKGWTKLDDSGCFRVVKFAKYHRTREPDKIPSYPSYPSEPSEHKKSKSATLTGGAVELKKKKELDPQIKAIADKIYRSDRKKFERLIVWIKQAQKHHFADEVIAAALREFERYAATVTDWYPYLDKIIDKVEKNFNAQQVEKDSNGFKEVLNQVLYSYARSN